MGDSREACQPRTAKGKIEMASDFDKLLPDELVGHFDSRIEDLAENQAEYIAQMIDNENKSKK